MAILCPVESWPGPVRLTQGFGLHPEVYKQFGLKGHNGLDYTGPTKGKLVPIYAPMDCIVTQVGDQGEHGYGKFVRVRSLARNRDEQYRECVFGHLSDHTVKSGDVLSLGTAFATMGNTGFSSGPHLHWGLRFLDKNMRILNEANGFSGYIDQSPWVLYWKRDPSGMVVMI